MLRIRDLLDGKKLFGLKAPPSGSWNCKPTLPKDPPPVKPGEPWCDVGPSLKVGKGKKRGSRK